MPSLAERRVKQKISRDPQNKFWQNDTGKFGRKMLEKMGWKNGAGLGAKEQGVAAPISLSANVATRGLGCDLTAEHNWVAHQDNFDDLLAQLNSSKTPSVPPEIGVRVLKVDGEDGNDIGRINSSPELVDPSSIATCAELNAGKNDTLKNNNSFEVLVPPSKVVDPGQEDVSRDATTTYSLEKRSKNSKARLHYHKFARGKDLSLASRSDMDAIMGRLVRKRRRPIGDGGSGQHDDVAGIDENPQFISKSTSIADYFKTKLAAKTGATVSPEEPGPCEAPETMDQEALDRHRSFADYMPIPDERQSSFSQDRLEDVGETSLGVCGDKEYSNSDGNVVVPPRTSTEVVGQKSRKRRRGSMRDAEDSSNAIGSLNEAGEYKIRKQKKSKRSSR